MILNKFLFRVNFDRKSQKIEEIIQYCIDVNLIYYLQVGISFNYLIINIQFFLMFYIQYC